MASLGSPLLSLVEWSGACKDAPSKLYGWKDAPGPEAFGVCTLFSSCCSALGSVGAVPEPGGSDTPMLPPSAQLGGQSPGWPKGRGIGTGLQHPAQVKQVDN